MFDTNHHPLKNCFTKYCVLSVRNNKETRTPWFRSLKNAKLALQIIKAKGFRAIIYHD